MSAAEFAFALLIAVGLVGTVVPLLPGGALVAAAIIAWAAVDGSGRAWWFAAACITVFAIGTGVKYLIPGRHLQRSGVPTRSLMIGAGLGVVGFFAIPLVGLPLGFVAGLYAAEWQRVGRASAWSSTTAALKAIGVGVLIEIAFTATAAGIWLYGALST